MSLLLVFTLLRLAGLTSAIGVDLNISTCLIPKIVPQAFQSTCALGPGHYWDPDEGTTARDDAFAGAENFVASGLLGKHRLSWSYEPFCLFNKEFEVNFCVYTSTKFARGRGISFIGMPEHVSKATDMPLFQSPKYFNTDEQDYGTDFTQTKFEHRSIRGKGNGVVSTSSLYQGDRIYSFTPILAVHDSIMQTIDDSPDLHLLLRVAVNRLPATSRKLFLDMHGHFGDDPYYDRLNTNAFAAPIGKAHSSFWALFPESAVRFQSQHTYMPTNVELPATQSQLPSKVSRSSLCNVHIPG